MKHVRLFGKKENIAYNAYHTPIAFDVEGEKDTIYASEEEFGSAAYAMYVNDKIVFTDEIPNFFLGESIIGENVLYIE